ncbi:Fe-S cluster assembly protein SufD [Goodfellowiella coeruleoviolacea]|nr:Fe-S cluster assembly protein SufD [Goodfellowiella coeruleoviolacea]
MTTTDNEQFGLTPHSHGAGVPLSTRADREDATSVPTGREENWRFTPLKRLTGLIPGQAATGEAVVTVDAPVTVLVDTANRDDERLGEAGRPTEYVSRLAWESFAKATVVTVPKEVVAAPTTITVTGPGAGNVAYGHLQVRLERFAEAVVVIDHRGSGSYADNIEFVVADGAKLTVVAVHDWADDAVHVSAHHARLGKDAVLRHTVVTLGGGTVRISPTVNYADKGGDAELLGLYFADAGQHLEHRTFVDHAVPNCRSNVVYKGALQGEGARTVWIGDVLIRAAAEGTETFELNRNLVLTDGARADSVPNLEIETGEIAGAGHASATGRFDDEQLFYLQARGIPEEQARRLVVRGFFHEVLMKISVPEVRKRLEEAIEAELEAVGG